MGLLPNRYGDDVRPTQSDVAAEAGVSRALVSLVFRDSPKVAPQTRERVLAAAKRLGYRPNALARSLASKENRTFGVFVYDARNPHLGELYESVARIAVQQGHELLVAPGYAETDQEPALITTLLAHQVAGLILLSPEISSRRLRPLVADRPSVLVSGTSTITGLDSVTTDEIAALRPVISRLVELGHRDILHVSGGPERSGRERSDGFRAAMAEAGLEPEIIEARFSEEAGRRAAEQLLTERRMPTAIIAANDLIGIGVMSALMSAGIRVPEDVSIVGYDDSPVAGLEMVQLASVRQEVDALARAGFDLLLNRMANPELKTDRRHLPATFVERRSIGRARKRRLKL